MAINMQDFPEKIDIGLKANKGYTTFFYRFKREGRTKRGILNYEDKEWDKRTRVSKAKAEFDALKSKGTSTIDFNENSTLDFIAKIYFTTSANKSKWNDELYDVYQIYASPVIGKKKIKDLRKVHLDKIKSNMEEQGNSTRTKNGCSPRTIKKVLRDSLKPILQYALDNKVIDELPSFPVVKQNRKKKKVSDASIKLATLFTTISDLYKEEPFYKSLFVFALYGRRWNEIRTLSWQDVDLLQNIYTVKAENNKIREDQTYDLPAPVAQALLGIKDEHVGLVFKSPITGKELHPPKKQLAKIKEHANIPELTMHYFRHILVSAMGEMGTATTILSASLGHTNLDTVNNFYLSANHTKASQEANRAIERITNK